ncbi:MAG: carbon-nitrogen hydrolase [Planctomycetota bacterium]|nr:carbon-nitrogen hydrolase [Planctomycetota bacterium]
MSASRNFTVGLVQMGMSADPAENLAKACAKVEEAAAKGAQVVCLPELFRGPYFCQTEDLGAFDLAETVPGPSTEALAQVARARQVVVIASLFEKRAEGLYHNTVAVLDADGRLAGRYRKMHIPDDPGFYEKFYFTPGDLGFQAIETRAGKLGTLICWDQWYPEAARLTALQGAPVLFYPTAIGWHPKLLRSMEGLEMLDAWRTVQRGHAIANGVYVAAVNRIGHEKPAAGGDGLVFWGTSFLCDPFGSIVEEAADDKEQILVAEIDLARVERTRREWPFLRDRRIDAYGGLERRFLDGPV